MGKRIFIFIFLAGMMMVSGCETVKGIGRDITGASSTIQEKMTASGRSSQKY